MDRNRIGSNVRDARQRAGLSQEGLARRIDVSTFTVSRLERGATRTVTVDLLARVAGELGVSVATLLDEAV